MRRRVSIAPTARAGTLGEADTWSVAVVGTRGASPAGIERAARLSGLLVSHHVTVISGLARGIGTAVHQAALDGGGRTIAVLGTAGRGHKPRCGPTCRPVRPVSPAAPYARATATCPHSPIAARNNMAAAPARREPICVAAEALDGN